MLQVKSQVKLRILTIFNFCVKMDKLKKSTVLQNSKNLVFFYETLKKIRSSDQNPPLFQSPTLIIQYTVYQCAQTAWFYHRVCRLPYETAQYKTA